MHKISYFLEEAWHGILSHRLMSIAAATSIAAALILTGTLALIYINIRGTVDVLQQSNSFVAYVDEKLSEDNAKLLEDQIKQTVNVKSVAFKTREQALDEFSTYMNDPLFSELPSTVLRHRYIIGVEDVTRLEDTIQRVSLINGIASVSASLDVAQGSLDIGNAVTAISSVFVAILFILSFVSITNTVKMAAMSREKEIGIMRLCGVDDNFISAPFFYEGAILGLFGSLVAFIVEFLTYNSICSHLNQSEASRLIAFTPFSKYAFVIFCVFIVIGISSGIIGSVFTKLKYLKK